MKLIDDIKSCIWFARLMWRVSDASLPRAQWFTNAPDADVQWLADQNVSGEVDCDCRSLCMEAVREMRRRNERKRAEAIWPGMKVYERAEA